MRFGLSLTCRYNDSRRSRLRKEARSPMQLARERRRRHVAVRAIIIAAVCLSWIPSRSLRAETPGGKHVLVLFSHETASYTDFDRPLRASLTRDLTYPVDFFTEYLDLIRFPRDHHEQQIVDALRVEYEPAH